MFKKCKNPVAAFTILELMVSLVVFAAILVVFSTLTSGIVGMWTEGESRIETHQNARGALEIMTRELTPAVVDTRMQFAVISSSELARRGARHLVPGSPVMLWMAPLGELGGLRCVGYYLFRDVSRGFYRLKRIYIRPLADKAYFPVMVNENNPRDPALRISATNADWFLRHWDAKAFDEEDPANDAVVVSTVADNVIAFWVQCLDIAGNPVPSLMKAPHHAGTTMIYNSAAYFQMATTTAFDNNRTTEFLSPGGQSMKANRVPAAVDVTVVTVDSTVVNREMDIPAVENIFSKDGSLDVEQSILRFNRALLERNIKDARTFTTRVNLLNGQ